MRDYQVISESEALYLDACVLPKIDIEEIASKQARLTRILIYLSSIPVYCSFVSFGEFFNIAGKKRTQKRIGIAGYLFSCRALMIDQAMGKLLRAEPIEDKVQFLQLAQRLGAKFSQLGGGDVWHLMSAIQLQSRHRLTTLFSFDRNLVSAAKCEGIRAVYGSGLEPNLVVEELRKNGKLLEQTAGGGERLKLLAGKYIDSVRIRKSLSHAGALVIMDSYSQSDHGCG
jgi:hypothetical protein